jgi:CRP-like cAMP-binding protein
MIRVQNVLSQLSMFAEVDREEIARIASGAGEVIAHRGTYLYRRGDAASGLYILDAGQVKLSLNSERGNERVVELVQPGTTFGESALFSGRPHILTAEALADSQLVHLPKELMLSEMERDLRFCRAVMRLLGTALYRRLSEFEEYVLASGTERVISFLLRGQNGDAVRDNVTLPANKGIIASRLNLTHEHFSRILRDLTEAGLIEVQGREVRILNRKQLYAHVG